ncbi:hypothetical protein B2J93_1972 [Marssonina coronariae]|uniref:Uncharacterized protein n=1 Tax=Diplocarpon coronariae TaxID=2795749 RepID=A0A218ZGL7_9HELO|nr:hypothetical protein B2J93_1972 [Marssonina coronariae]
MPRTSRASPSSRFEEEIGLNSTLAIQPFKEWLLNDRLDKKFRRADELARLERKCEAFAEIQVGIVRDLIGAGHLTINAEWTAREHMTTKKKMPWPLNPAMNSLEALSRILG